MIQVIQKGINPILNQYDYPELKVRIGIDFGEVGVVQYGIDIDKLDGKAILTRPHIDMIGPTISIAVKMTSIAKPDQIVIGQKLYDMLIHKRKLSKGFQVFLTFGIMQTEQVKEDIVSMEIYRNATKDRAIFYN